MWTRDGILLWFDSIFSPKKRKNKKELKRILKEYKKFKKGKLKNGR